jgi:hypothetical protein
VNDNDAVLRRARAALPAGHMGIPVEKIMAMGRSRRHRRFAALSVTGTAAAAAVALGVTGVLAAGGHAAPVARGTIQTTGFTLVSNANGTDTLTLTGGQAFNPGALQRALSQAGIPALVTSGQLCDSHPQPQPPTAAIFSLQLPGRQPVSLTPWNVLRMSPAGFGHRIPGDAVLVINPAVLPAGTELWFGYRSDAQELFEGIVYQNSRTCRPFNTQPKAGTSSPLTR